MGTHSTSLPVTAFFTRMGEQFVRGRLREMTGAFAYPCPMELDGRLVVMRNAAMLEAALALRHGSALRDGLGLMQPRVLAIEMPRQSRFRVWLRWRYEFATFCVPDEAVSVYFMARTPWGGLRIEMMDLARPPAESPSA